MIQSFNYAEDLDADPNNDLDDEFQLTILAQDLGGGVRGRVLFADSQFNVDDSPVAGTVRIDNDGGGNGWFFDTTPLDDAEFTGIADVFSSSFVDVNSEAELRRDDFYRTVVHEIGHVLGITSDPDAAINPMLTGMVDNTGQAIRDPRAVGDPNFNGTTQLEHFTSTRPNPHFGVTATFIGGHLYEGDIYGANNDPINFFLPADLTTPLQFQAHENELLNQGVTAPAGNPDSNEPETVRQFITDLDAMILADAYGYTVALPSTLNTAHASFDQITGQLLVQGLSGGDMIEVSLVGTNDETIRVTVNGTIEDFVRDDVTQILIAVNGGSDTVTVAAELESLRQDIDYVVSSNEDANENGDHRGWSGRCRRYRSWQPNHTPRSHSGRERQERRRRDLRRPRQL